MPVYRLSREVLFPPPALADETGLLAVGGDLSLARLLEAYRNGIFPWYNVGEPILWWSPDPRMVLYPEQLHVPKRFAKWLKQAPLQLSMNTAFSEVVRACARIPRRGQEGTWITPEMEQAYVRLHRAGYALSVEVRQEEELVGGLYGVLLGRCFFGESMFHRAPNASKAALVYLVHRLREMEVELIDCQQETPLLTSFGAQLIPRQQFLEEMAPLVQGALNDVAR